MSRRSWRGLWQAEKVAVAFQAAARRNGLAFTLNLSTEREGLLMRHNDPADALRRYIARELRSVFQHPLPLGFQFEVAATTGKIHVHGVVILPDNTTGAADAFKQALMRAGGKITGRGAARQCDVKPITDGLGWAVYSQKNWDTACNYLHTNKITFISTGLKRLCKENHRSYYRVASIIVTQH